MARLSARTDETTIPRLLGIAWRAVGSIIERVTTGGAARRHRLEGLRGIGINEISYRKGHKYILVVVDRDTGLLVWAKLGRKAETVGLFVEELGPTRCAALTLVRADGAEWIHDPVRKYCPKATLCLDPFHIVQWATDALDEVRRGLWSELRRNGAKAEALTLQRGWFALWKNPENLTHKQREKRSSIQAMNSLSTAPTC